MYSEYHMSDLLHSYYHGRSFNHSDVLCDHENGKKRRSLYNQELFQILPTEFQTGDSDQSDHDSGSGNSVCGSQNSQADGTAGFTDYAYYFSGIYRTVYHDIYLCLSDSCKILQFCQKHIQECSSDVSTSPSIYSVDGTDLCMSGTSDIFCPDFQSTVNIFGTVSGDRRSGCRILQFLFPGQNI